MSIKIEDMANEIVKGLENYSEETAKEIKEAVDDVADECMKEIKKHITFRERTGKYVKSLKLKTVYENDFGKTKVWYASNGQHRLTHLLEKGHVTRNGGRTREFPHIKYGDDLVKEKLPKKIEEIIKNGK